MAAYWWSSNWHTDMLCGDANKQDAETLRARLLLFSQRCQQPDMELGDVLLWCRAEMSSATIN